jgi:hypothetical protein
MVFFAAMVGVVLAQAPTTTLSGTVVGPKCEPISDAEVVLADLPMYNPPILARGRSDAAGRFAIERPAGLAGAGRYTTPALWIV